MEDTLVVIPYFNFYPKKDRLAILKDSLEGVTKVCDVWLIHCGESLNFKVPSGHTQLNSSDALKCFQKEALINHALSRLTCGDHPEALKRSYKRVIFIDADVQPYGKGTWSQFIRKCEAFGPQSYGQPCSHFLTPQGLLESTTSRLLKNQNEDWTYQTIKGTAPGGCWVVGWDALYLYTQYPFCFVGGGDSVYVSSFVNVQNEPSFFLNRMAEDIRKQALQYSQGMVRSRLDLGCSLTTLNEKYCLHSKSHGQGETKNYVNRHDLYNFSGIISEVSYTPGELVKPRKTDKALMLSSFISGYMENL